MKHVFREGEGYIVNQDAGGISLEILPQGGGFDHPFKVTYRKDGDNFKIKVRAGTVNNLVPTISSTYLDAEEAPELTITGTGHQDIVLEAELGDTPVFFPNNIFIKLNSSTPSAPSATGRSPKGLGRRTSPSVRTSAVSIPSRRRSLFQGRGTAPASSPTPTLP